MKASTIIIAQFFTKICSGTKVISLSVYSLFLFCRILLVSSIWPQQYYLEHKIFWSRPSKDIFKTSTLRIMFDIVNNKTTGRLFGSLRASTKSLKSFSYRADIIRVYIRGKAIKVIGVTLHHQK